METEIIRGSCYNVKKACTIGAIAVFFIGVLIYTIQIARHDYLIRKLGSFGAAWWHCLFGKSEYGNPFGGYVFAGRSVIPAVIISILILIIKWWLGSMEIVVTNKRVYGKAAFGKRVDMPFDSISAISLSAMKGIAVATSPGKIAFKFIRNNREVHTEISKLLIDRQSEKRPVANGFVNSSPYAVAELKEYKALLDSGVITQEEFEIKKKQILNL